MHDHHSVETILARLMPPAMSTGGQRNIEAMLDGLAGATAKPSGRKPPIWRFVIGGLAACLAALAAMRLANPDMQVAGIASARPDFLLVGESDRVESMIDEGWRETPDGTPMRALRMRIVEENSLLDEETGIVMQVSEPREELLLMPVSTF
jgi:hypothetical protein